ncbi:MAG: hypothetical protein K6G12_06930 [Lachnospiraceae bacterium]|nr:hypothetical protein [Lachnospiraceae bacterium]
MGIFDPNNNNAGQTVKEIVLSSLPTTLSQMQAMPEAALTDPYATAALTVVALNEYSIDKEIGKQMLDLLNGPDNVSNFDEQFMKDRAMDGHDYIARSYFKGATPDNNYTPDKPYTVKIMENSHSRDSEGYLILWIYSGGADSPREIQLRLKPSTNQWFATGWRGLLTGIRTPKAADPWA